MIPVIALLGRSNVGKSSLFNLLTRQHAVVADEPGTTRDYLWGQGEYQDHYFWLIDHAGFDGATDKEQVRQSGIAQSLNDCDAIFFVVDGQSGLQATEHSLAQECRRSGKPIYLLVNKIDHTSQEHAVHEFSELGIGTCFAVSAKQRRGLAELFTHFFNSFTVEHIESNAWPGAKAAIVGRPNVGKSTLLNRLLGQNRVQTADQPGTTRDSIYVPITRHGQPYVWIDTAGVRRRSQITEGMEKSSVKSTLRAIDEADVVIFLIHCHEGITEQDLRLIRLVMLAGTSLVIGFNQWDRLDSSQRKYFLGEVDRRLKHLDFARRYTLSALHGSGIGQLYRAIDEACAVRQRVLSTTLLTELLIKAQQNHPPPLVSGRRIRLRYAHLGNNKPPVIVIHGKQTEHLPGSYQQYLINYFRQAQKLWGLPLQLKLITDSNPYRTS